MNIKIIDKYAYLILTGISIFIIIWYYILIFKSMKIIFLNFWNEISISIILWSNIIDLIRILLDFYKSPIILIIEILFSVLFWIFSFILINI